MAEKLMDRVEAAQRKGALTAWAMGRVTEH